jgi:hypothetical protein
MDVVKKTLLAVGDNSSFSRAVTEHSRMTGWEVEWCSPEQCLARIRELPSTRCAVISSWEPAEEQVSDYCQVAELSEACPSLVVCGTRAWAKGGRTVRAIEAGAADVVMMPKVPADASERWFCEEFSSVVTRELRRQRVQRSLVHDTNNLIAVALGYIEVLKSDCTSSQPMGPSELALAASRLDLVSGAVRQLRARIASKRGRPALPDEPKPLLSFVREAVRRQTPLLGTVPVTFCESDNGAADIVARFDPWLLEQFIANVLTNVSDEDSVRSVRVCVSRMELPHQFVDTAAAPQASYVFLHFYDDGDGFRKLQLDQLRSSTSVTSTKAPGQGKRGGQGFVLQYLRGEFARLNSIMDFFNLQELRAQPTMKGALIRLRFPTLPRA